MTILDLLQKARGVRIGRVQTELFDMPLTVLASIADRIDTGDEDMMFLWAEIQRMMEADDEQS